MAGSDTYIPPSDEGFRTWGETFSSVLNASPGSYMLTSGQTASIVAVIVAYVSALAIAKAEGTRTKATIAAKDDKKAIAMTLCRQYAMILKDNLGISDELKITAGVRPINPARTPIECPQTSPVLTFVEQTPGVQIIRFADANTPTSKSKPFGASELQLFVGIGTEEPAPQSACQFYGKFTKNAIEVEFDEEDDGKMATMYARWASVRGETGPWSLPLTMRIAA